VENATSTSEEEEGMKGWWVFLVIVIFLLLSAFFSGNNVGVLAMDMRYLELVTEGPFENKKEQKRAEYARALLPMKRLGNQILVMVLLMVSLLNSAISIFMADIEGSLSGFLLSTSLIVIFAEIMPQAIMNSDPFFFCYYSRYFMYLCFGLTYIVAAPLGIIIDRILGEEEGNFLSRSRMKKLFEKYE
jgi:metal transporter CNNM